MQVKAAVLYEVGKAAPYADSNPLSVEKVELAAPGPGEVLVEVVSAGLCHSDLSVINGSMYPQLPNPMILGHEASGIVREVGPGVADLKVDDHVVFSFVPMCGHCDNCAVGRPVLCKNGSIASARGTLLSGARRFSTASGQPISYFTATSAFSQFTVVSQESLVVIDRDVPLDKAALLGCALITGVGAIVNTARVAAGESVVVFGLGGVGLSAIMGAKLAGASPIIAVDMLPSKFELARRLGADHTIEAGKDDPVAAIRELTKGGAAYAFDIVGNTDVLAQAFKAIRPGGKAIAVGIPPSDKFLSVHAAAMVVQEKVIQGCFMGSAVPRRDIARLAHLYMSGKLPLDELLSPSITLEEINTGFDRLAQGTAIRQLIRFKE
ncbi:zinc-binding dehydrogenase [Dictyobacter formicarum]|uniref:Alcohol dehydrogenase n=1 Tax=Dictyobacter formicarum TaxID=2778368 RepID=A0ABQ3VP56_9CHLR|nr:zinc-binding dehydrogenase [Dictyobacter formicarum]GHO87469.1 alcohol dehydrogenase [Dictyobacter formicarum]